MPKDRDRKIEEAIVRAESAQQAALNALTMAQVLGSILESTLAMLQAKEVVAPDDLRQIFFGAAAAIDELKPSNENERGAQTGHAWDRRPHCEEVSYRNSAARPDRNATKALSCSAARLSVIIFAAPSTPVSAAATAGAIIASAP